MKISKKEKVDDELLKIPKQDIAELSLDEQLKRTNAGHKRERFEVVKMWCYYIGSMIAKDRGTIPDNIGNKILITSNMYITKLYLSSIMQVTVAGLNVPVTFIQELTSYLRDKKCNVVVDATFKRQLMTILPTDTGLTSRIRTWENTLKMDYIPDKQKEMSARCIYTADLIESTDMTYTRLYITLRAKSGSELKRAEVLAGKFLAAASIVYLPITSNIRETLEYTSILSDKYSNEVKDVKALVTSDLTLAQMMPNTGAYNGSKGLWIGVNILNNSHFIVDFEAITVARNLYVLAPSGVGKTVLLSNMMGSALEKDNWRVCAMDIKGNEIVNLCKSVNGLILDLTPKSREYINSFKMNAEYATYDDSSDYFKDNINLSKDTMLILSGIPQSESYNEADQLIDKFLITMYSNMGVTANNKNTWSRTHDLNAYEIYDKFTEYMTPTQLKNYRLSGEKLINNLRPYMSRNGTRSYIFKREFDINKIYTAKMIVFNFGMLMYGSDTSQIDNALFRLKFAYSQRINNAYVYYNFSNQFETLKILEESQIVPPEILRKYVEEFTLRRAQRQTTVLAGNSIQALLDNNISKPLIENTRALLIGDLPAEARNEVIKQFDLEYARRMIEIVGSTEEYTNSFTFINKMQSDPLVPIIKLQLDKTKPRNYYKQFTPSKDFTS